MKNIHLTPREKQVAEFITLGLTNKEIAGVLGRQSCTVKAFVESILRKTGAKNRTHLAYLLGCRHEQF